MATDARMRDPLRAGRAQSVPRLFAIQAELTPDAVAVNDGGTRLDYAALDAASNRLAHALIAAGVRPGDPVGVCLERSVRMVTALLAVLKAGGAYLALDTGQPRERHRILLEDARPGVVLTEEKFAGDVSGLGAGCLVLDGADAGWERQPAGTPEVALDGESPAYIAYTSGSTGRPKGVVVPHRAVLRLVTGPNFLTVGADDVVLQFAPVAFDASTLELWAPLLNGARLALCPPGRVSLDELAAVVEREGVTILWLTAGLFHQMVEGPLERLSGVRQLLAGGDVLSAAHVDKALGALPGVRLVNGYGPTENTTFTCCHVMTGHLDSDTVPIGVPVTGTRVYVLDEHGEPVPDGEPGELYAGGDGVALGYLNQPEQTAERFVTDTFGPEPGRLLYRTGDLVRRRPDGVLEFLGRADSQVKIRGYRVEPGEIEAALLAREEITDAAVVPQDQPGGRRLVAFYVGDFGLSVPELRAALGAVLPAYLVPGAFVRLPELPLTANGKVDRAALLGEIFRDRPEMGSDYRAPEGAVERELAQIWGDLMEIDEIGADDDFFELGGHSLMAVQITARITARWGVDVTARNFYENPTVAELAEVIEELTQ
ncbi:Linear gramicidin synthase subunit B [Streptomyces sp. RB5]|uniref:Linear gramicidin synthase subunit B n=1 Tax=Streptomyces smaragdinus TaxID=2585196 RepID=A0A7K0CH93_9ACTN|nr:non-ribosomal peptide synthetase [Streptomyces smaragdinus]MQY12850.1 Linear gramicidin synthase subunit B [Streptomyces smaragdinus]